ncbi:MAG TPA: phosphatidylglycerophosphatase A [Solibacterales bacterium]|nr:phosphatidylglycerophosphatase A [Bryobacterales bacterium]
MSEAGAAPRGWWLLATWFGCGLAPKAPGTAGSVGALIVVPLWIWAGWHPAWLLALAAVMTAPAIRAATAVARASARKDPQIVVVDEVLGVWVTLAAAPAMTGTTVLAALALFRLFDIWKPWPVRRLEALPAGTGIVADDLAAGVYGALVLWAGGWFNLY